MPDSFTPNMGWDDPDRHNAIKIFHQQCDLYFSVKDVPATKQVDHILLFAGVTGLKLYNSWGLSDEEKKDPAAVWKRFETQLQPKTNFRVARLYLQKYVQQEGESADDFMSRLKLQAYTCEFRDDTELQERVIEQLIAGLTSADLQKELLGKDKSLTIDKALEIARTFEATQSHMAQLARVQPGRSVDVVTARQMQNLCPNCGVHHAQQPRQACPAFGTNCNRCGKLNHWRKCCRSKLPVNRSQPAQRASGRPRGHRKIDSLDKGSPSNVPEDIAESFDVLHFEQIVVSNISAMPEDRKDAAMTFVTMKRDSHTHARVRSKVDTGAEGNTLPLRIYRKMYPGRLTMDGYPDHHYVSHSATKLTAYNGTAIKHYGAVQMPCRFNSSPWVNATFYIVESEGPSIIGLDTSLELKLVSMHTGINAIDHKQQVLSTADLVKTYPEQFDRIGEFEGEYHIVLDPNVRPVVHAPRRCPIHVHDELKQELDNMEAQGVLTKVTEPTPWVSSMVLARKGNGHLRICLDPKDLNRAVQRCHYRTITTDEITHRLTGSRYFSKLDAKNGYWSIKLDEDSSLMTTFNSPFGRYRYLRMSFGLSMSQDVFQQRMDEILEGCPGVVGIADDIIVSGKTEEEHDQNLHNLMRVAQKRGLQFNSEKCAIKVPKIAFFGMVYDANGVHPDPKKVDAIKSMSPPDTKAQLREFLGMVTYLSPFIPNLSSQTSSLRELLKEDAVFTWTQSHQQAFDSLRDQICKDATLAYFDSSKDTVIQVDASMQGLGATLMQDNKPIAYASKSLSDAETRYANIERELLAVVFGCERFHTHVYGKTFVVESDHKPLEMIRQKPLTAAPPRLQRMLMRLQSYDMSILYRPGKEVPVADCLSRSPLKENDHIELDVTISFVQFAPDRLSQLKQETSNDTELAALRETIVQGWPQQRRDVAKALQPYWGFRDELAVEDGLVLKGERLVIPQSMHAYIMSKLHEGHQGMEKK